MFIILLISKCLRLLYFNKIYSKVALIMKNSKKNNIICLLGYSKWSRWIFFFFCRSVYICLTFKNHSLWEICKPLFNIPNYIHSSKSGWQLVKLCICLSRCNAICPKSFPMVLLLTVANNSQLACWQRTQFKLLTFPHVRKINQFDIFKSSLF